MSPYVYVNPPKRATLRTMSNIKSSIKVKSAIGKRSLALRKQGRTAAIRRAERRGVQRGASEMAANYEPRVMAREFEPTALKARDLADRRGISLHELAYQLGYATAPPRMRKKVDVSAISRSELAAITEYDLTEISRLFARRHPPKLSKLARIAAAYGVWMDDMLVAIGW